MTRMSSSDEASSLTGGTAPFAPLPAGVAREDGCLVARADPCPVARAEAVGDAWLTGWAATACGDGRADQMKSQGFPTKPDVTIEGFPFLTQVARRHIDHIHITASHVKEGPVRLSMMADATDVVLNSGFQSGTITHVTGTGLIAFSDLASAAEAAGAPGLKISAAGPDKVKLDVNVLGIDASATAAIEQTGPHTFKVRLTSTGGIPASLLGPLNFSINIPDLPMNLSIRSVQVTSKGVVIHVTGSNIKFSQ
jgi:hypothetical protein